MTDPVAVVMVVCDEPRARLQRAIGALGEQQGVTPFPVYIAAPVPDHAAIRSLQPLGAVHAIVPVENPLGTRCAGLNRAIDVADAEVLVRVDARSRVRPDHVARSLARLQRDARVGVVGGVQWPAVLRDDARTKGTVRALRNRWLLGNAHYRRPGASGPVDTVYLGSFRASEMRDLGGYNERLLANEDYELCRRYVDAGFRVWLEDGLTVDYEPRTGASALFKQYRAFGEAKVEFWRATRRRPNRRQQVAIGLAGLSATAFAVSARRPVRAAALSALILASVAAVDHFADPAEADLRVRAHAWLASYATVSGWVVGVVRGVLRHRNVPVG